MSIADCSRMRNPGTIESAWPWIDGANSGVNPITYGFIITLDKQAVLWVYGAGVTSTFRYAWYDVAGNSFFSAFGSFSLRDEESSNYSLNPLGRSAHIVMRDRILLFCDRGALIWDTTSPISAPTGTPRHAGVRPPSSIFVSVNTTSPGFFPGAKACHITAIIRKKFSDGYEAVSAPMYASQARSLVNATAGVLDIQVNFFATSVAAGDVLELYRTRLQDYADGPGSVDTGSDYYLFRSVTLTSANVAARLVAFLDYCPDSGLGQALYTNQGVQGASAAAFPPPTATAAAAFRGYAFAGNVTYSAKIKVRVPVFWGLLNLGASTTMTVRKSSVGNRFVTGNITSGLNTITGVSSADMVGITVGQLVFVTPSRFSPSVTEIIAVGASTITLSTNATSSGTGVTEAFVDTFRLRLNGGVGSTLVCPSGSVDGLAQQLSANFETFLLSRVYSELKPANVTGAFSQAGTEAVISSGYVHGDNTQYETFTVTATNGANYVPAIPAFENGDVPLFFDRTPQPNLLVWSEENQPENWPVLNSVPVGKGEIYALASTRDALWIFASDGLWRLSGTGGSAGAGFDWRVDPVDSTISLSGPQAFCTVRDNVYAYTNRGFVEIDSSGNVRELSQGRINDILPGPPWSTPNYSATSAIFCVSDEAADEIILRDAASPSGKVWVYNTLTDTFVTDQTSDGTLSPVHGAFSRTLQRVILVQASTGSPGNLYTQFSNFSTTGNFAPWLVKYQPVSHGNPFTVTQWQNVDLAFELPNTSTTVAVSAFANSTLMGTRNVTTGLTQDTSIFSRTSFTVPRTSPAVANNIAFSFSVPAGQALSVSSGTMKLQGFAIYYSDPTDQRKNR
jgi:hypothetical protein